MLGPLLLPSLWSLLLGGGLLLLPLTRAAVLVGSKKQRAEVVELIRRRKLLDPGYRVVDVGPGAPDGGKSNWSWGVADVFVGHAVQRYSSHRKVIDVDVESAEDWAEVLQYVAANGKFNFSICSHILEDLQDPTLLLRHLRDISHEGFIAVPSKFFELYRGMDSYGGSLHHGGEFKALRGMYHHHSIFTVMAGRVFVLPKDATLELDPFLERLTSQALVVAFNELRWYWPPWPRFVSMTRFGGLTHRIGIVRDLLSGDDVTQQLQGHVDGLVASCRGEAACQDAEVLRQDVQRIAGHQVPRQSRGQQQQQRIRRRGGVVGCSSSGSTCR